MVFGGIFGGGSNGGNNNSSKPASVQQPSEFSSSHDPSSSASPSTMSGSPLFSNQSGVSPASGEIKSKYISTITEQVNVMNARQLIQKVNENCFDHCITAPGSSLSSKEQGCLSACMEKYIEGWNTVSKTYISRLQREGAQQAGQAQGGSGMF